MKKEQTNIIPKALYERLELYIKETKDTTFSKYVFQTCNRDWLKQNQSISEKYFRIELNKFIIQNNIIDEFGKLYNIDIHGYRHAIGTQLNDMGVSVFVIQKTLHHVSIEMTMAYVDVKKEKVKKAYNNFIKISGKKMEFSYDDEKTILDYLKKEFNVQALPNGICALPAKLNKCPHANACLNCDNFGTSIEFY
jgi:integrase